MSVPEILALLTLVIAAIRFGYKLKRYAVLRCPMANGSSASYRLEWD